MRYNAALHRRLSIRLRGFDYSLAGAYTVTVYVQERLCLLGEIINGVMHRNDAGWMVERWWAELHDKFAGLEQDAFVVMPNHIHGIIVLPGPDDSSVGADLCVCPPSVQGGHAGPPLPSRAPSLPIIVQWFKTMTTNEYIRGVQDLGWPPFRSRLWQRNYYEHIIRNDETLERHRRYILENPQRWADDQENPANARVRRVPIRPRDSAGR